VAARAGDERAFVELTSPWRSALHAHCYRLLGSLHDADDALQETLLRAWRAIDRYEPRAPVSAWLYRIATNVCLRMLEQSSRRGAISVDAHLEPYPEPAAPAASEPAAHVESDEAVGLAFVAAMQLLPPRQRVVLVLRDVLDWSAREVAELLEVSEAAVNSALQRARATLETSGVESAAVAPQIEGDQRELLTRYVEAFERYDIEALTSLIREDARQSMPPFDLWLEGREDMFTWWWGPGIGCKGSKLLPAPNANGQVAFGQYKPSESGSGYDPWALQVVEFDADGLIKEMTFFLDTERVFPLFGLPPRIEE